MSERSKRDPSPKVQPLRLAREVRGFTQFELGERAGMSQAAVSKLEKPGRSPRQATVQRLATALEVRPESIFPRDDGELLRRALTEYFEGKA